MKHIKFSAFFVENELKSVRVQDPGGCCHGSEIRCGMFSIVCG